MNVRANPIPAVDGPLADDLEIGVALPTAPSITFDEGLAAGYQAITGDPLRLPLSAELSRTVTGERHRLVNPALVLQIAIGQSTVATKRVIANLFYRDVALHRHPHIGETLTTTVTPVARALTRPGPNGRRAKVLLQISAVDQDERPVARFERLALLPCRNPDTLHDAGAVGSVTSDRALQDYFPFVPQGWDFTAHPAGDDLADRSVTDPLADTVDAALALVRLTQNQAAAHRDPAAGIGGRRLVYGGHAIGLAQASLARLVPGLVSVLGWRGCDHLAPVFEGDVLRCEVQAIDALDVAPGLRLVGYRVLARATDRPDQPVLDWRPVALVRIPTTQKG